MIEKISDIRNALKNNCPYCALALALTLPDICARVAYPDKCTPQARAEAYRMWFDENVAKKYFKVKGYCPEEIESYFNGYACYLLRCAFLHSGNFDLISHNSKIRITDLRIYFNRDNNLFHGNTFAITDDDKFELELDVFSICYSICKAAEDFYNSIDNKALFNDNNFNDMSAADEFRIQLMG